jgi:negative regulator of flagellin synthesis FlgM
MSHKIDGTTPQAPVSRPATEPRTPAPQAPRPAEHDTVDVTDAARLMQRVEAILAAAPATDQNRVEEVKRALASGAYEIDPERIAAQVARLERDLFARV